MPLKTGSIEEPNLNLTPMIDIVFLLIIFFMVGTQFTTPEDRFPVELPTAAAVQPLSSMPDALSVSVSRDGRIMMNAKEMTVAELEAELKKARENFPRQAVVIRGEGPGPYQPVIDVLSVAQRAGIQDISLAYRTNQD